MDAASPPPAPPVGLPVAEAYEATCLYDGTGRVVKGAELTTQEAVDRRKQELDVVVCGPSCAQNFWTASDIESQVGPAFHERAHRKTAGPRALNHYHQKFGYPDGHTFYEQPPTHQAV